MQRNVRNIKYKDNRILYWFIENDIENGIFVIVSRLFLKNILRATENFHFFFSIISSFTIRLGIDELYLGLFEVNVNITYLENLSALVIHLLFLLYSTAFIIRTLWLCGLHYLLFIGKEKCSTAFWYF